MAGRGVGEKWCECNRGPRHRSRMLKVSVRLESPHLPQTCVGVSVFSDSWYSLCIRSGQGCSVRPQSPRIFHPMKPTSEYPRIFFGLVSCVFSVWPLACTPWEREACHSTLSPVSRFASTQHCQPPTRRVLNVDTLTADFRSTLAVTIELVKSNYVSG